ncbi:hypothetical protein DPMN_120207 [Dreissena polymorpha]|uniref:Uncharacterized protein n=1 Tax=Dreissena polymorpha TaxID=45954 RepID=A0A9D4GN77_DREPO|nr:hypothetical protein DPMN_120207 [Dreissena polymorpha]
MRKIATLYGSNISPLWCKKIPFYIKIKCRVVPFWTNGAIYQWTEIIFKFVADIIKIIEQTYSCIPFEYTLPLKVLTYSLHSRYHSVAIQSNSSDLYDEDPLMTFGK